MLQIDGMIAIKSERLLTDFAPQKSFEAPFSAGEAALGGKLEVGIFDEADMITERIDDGRDLNSIANILDRAARFAADLERFGMSRFDIGNAPVCVGRLSSGIRFAVRVEPELVSS